MKYSKILSIILIISIVFPFSLLLSSCQSSDYSKAKEYLDSGEYENALTILESLGDYEDSKDLIKECKYGIALNLINDKQYEKAISSLSVLGDYKDSIKKIDECNIELMKENIKNASIGDTIELGTLEGNSSNGEKIKWIVLAISGSKKLVISQNSLFEKHYHDPTTEDSTWETCELRKYLNGSFYNSTFNSEEKNIIIKSFVSAEENPQYPKGYFMGNKYTGSSAGNNTNDYVFIISVSEAEKYFYNDNDRKCALIGNSNPSSWWLRNGGQTQISATTVSRDGSILLMGLTKSSDNIAVRPAMWLEVK